MKILARRLVPGTAAMGLALLSFVVTTNDWRYSPSGPDFYLAAHGAALVLAAASPVGYRLLRRRVSADDGVTGTVFLAVAASLTTAYHLLYLSFGSWEGGEGDIGGSLLGLVGYAMLLLTAAGLMIGAALDRPRDPDGFRAG